MESQENIVDIMQNFLDSRLLDLHTTIPGKILSYDPHKQLASVQPLIRLQRKVNQDIITVEIPPIDNVPVMNLSTSKFILKFPIGKGDGCAIFFSEVGIGNFLNGMGEIVDPDDISRFSLTDAFCIPGLWGKNTPTGTSTIELTDSGILNLLGGSSSFTKGEELETLLNNFLNAVASIVPGDQVANAAALTIIKTAAATALPTVAGIKSLKIKGA